MEACWDAAARLAALALAICSLNAADDFLAVAAAGDSLESAITVESGDIFEALEATAPGREVADEANEAPDTLLRPELVTC